MPLPLSAYLIVHGDALAHLPLAIPNSGCSRCVCVCVLAIPNSGCPRCLRYIELNPVRAGMVALPADYRWSSHSHNALDGGNPRVSAHRAYLDLGQSAHDRRQAYCALFTGTLDETEIADLRAHTQQQRVWASEKFRKQIEVLAHRAAGVRPRGRPRSEATGTGQSSADNVPDK